MTTKLNRRTFIKASSTAGGGFLVSLTLPGSPDAQGKTQADLTTGFLEITKDERLLITLPSVEMGQGAQTGMAAVICEELDGDFRQVHLQSAPYDAKYKHLVRRSKDRGQHQHQCLVDPSENLRRFRPVGYAGSGRYPLANES